MTNTKKYLAHQQYHLNSYGLRAFSVAAAILWNALPDRPRQGSKMATDTVANATNIFSLVTKNSGFYKSPLGRPDFSMI